MKADITRNTFRKEKNYRRVIKQQGRVDVDADPNEFQDIEIHHERTSLRDVIGKSGAPIENPGFAIIPAASYYKIGKGRYYVDGILVENYDDAVDASNQPDLPIPDSPIPDLPTRTSVQYPGGARVYALPEEPGIYAAYLHVWERHITALDDHDIQESALGGPDSANRSKVVWQVQLLRLGNIPTISAKIALVQQGPAFTVVGLQSFEEGHDGDRRIKFTERSTRGIVLEGVIQVEDHHAKDSIELTVTVQDLNGVSLASQNIEVLEKHQNAGIFEALLSLERGRVLQITDKDGPKDLGEFPVGTKILVTYNFESVDVLSKFSCNSGCQKLDALNPSLGALRARAEPEISDTMCMIPPQAKYTGLENLLYRVEIHDDGATSSDTEVPAARPRFKWSAVNGIVVTKITNIDDTTGILTVSDTGKDRNLGFAPQQWVEVTDDLHELWRLPGTFVKLDDVDPKNNELRFAPHAADGRIIGNPITKENFPLNAKVRRWDYKEGQEALRDVKIAPDNETYIELDSGVQIQFIGQEPVTYMTGNYWLIPARTLKRDIEWPRDENGPKALLPEGIQHHYTCLAILKYSPKVVDSFDWEKITSEITGDEGLRFTLFLIKKLRFEWLDSPTSFESNNIKDEAGNVIGIKISAGDINLSRMNTLTIMLNPHDPNSATSAAVIFQERTVYEFAVVREGENGTLKIQSSPVELISDCRKFFPPAIDRTGAATITTGIITIKAMDLQLLGHQEEFDFGPFKHGIENAETPPAIILGKVPTNTPDLFPPEDRNENISSDVPVNYISFMEDHLLYDFKEDKDPYDSEDEIFVSFKAVGINLKTFKIKMKHDQPTPLDLTLRFWAISAGKQVDPQVYQRPL